MNLHLLTEAHRLDRAGLWLEAEAAYRAFLALEPAHAGAWADFGGLMMVLKHPDEAREACLRALELAPGLTEARTNLACLLVTQGHMGAATELFTRILEEDPLRNDARLALADCQWRQGLLPAAQATLARVLDQDPAHTDGHRMLSRILTEAGAKDLALAEVHRRFAALGEAQSAEATWEAAHCKLLFGDLPEAWELFESRLRLAQPGGLPQDHPHHPRWQGEPFPGRTLLVEFEQGLGDTLMFARFLAQAKARGGQVLLRAQTQLAGLLATCPGVDAVVPRDQPLPPFDLHVPLLSLPGLFGTGLADLPGPIPYLRVPDQVPNRGALAKALAPGQGRIRVGLAWAGNPIHKRDTERSLPAALLAPLATLAGVAWYSFHWGSDAPPLPGVVPLSPHLASFSDTAYALSAMDLVITVDTSLAHLAGAMGVPALVLLHRFPDWRWLLERSDSPWYPTLRLYRQPTAGAWPPVVQQILADLTS